jgi:hypothetical protein
MTDARRTVSRLLLMNKGVWRGVLTGARCIRNYFQSRFFDFSVYFSGGCIGLSFHIRLSLYRPIVPGLASRTHLTTFKINFENQRPRLQSTNEANNSQDGVQQIDVQTPKSVSIWKWRRLRAQNLTDYVDTTPDRTRSALSRPQVVPFDIFTSRKLVLRPSAETVELSCLE